MLAFGIALSCQLGRVVVAGSERKQQNAAVLYLWEWDPVPFLAGGAGSGTTGAPHSPRAGRAASGERRLGSPDSPNGSGKGGDDDGDDEPPGGSPSSGGDPPPGRTGLGGHSIAGGVTSVTGGLHPCGAAVGGLLARKANPLKIVASLEGGPLLCCACTQRGERALVVAGSSAGWLVVVDLTKEEEEAQVRARVLAAGALFAPSRVFCSAPQISHVSSNLLITPNPKPQPLTTHLTLNTTEPFLNPSNSKPSNPKPSTSQNRFPTPKPSNPQTLNP